MFNIKLIIMSTIIKSLSILFLFVFGSIRMVQAQQDTKNATANATTNLVNSKRYVFVAETVTPMGGGMRSLTSYYDFTVAGDTLISVLPYFGRSYSAPMSSSDAGINFKSTDFSYQIKEKEKGGWDIEIDPKGVASAKKMNLFISDNGYASLQVISNNRQPISFSGHIREISEKR